MRILRGLIWLLIFTILIALVGFVVQNPSELVDIHLAGTTYRNLNLLIALFIAFLAGVGLSMVFGFYFLLEQSIDARNLRIEKRALERELKALRNLSIEDALPPFRPPSPAQEAAVGADGSERRGDRFGPQRDL